MVSEYLRGLARKYLDMPVSEPGDALFTQIREECDKEGVSTREAFEFALRRPSPTPALLLKPKVSVRPTCLHRK
jgi:hypothetical protein